MNPATRTPLRTEAMWLLAILFVALGVAVGGAFYFVWRVLVAGAGC